MRISVIISFLILCTSCTNIEPTIEFRNDPLGNSVNNVSAPSPISPISETVWADNYSLTGSASPLEETTVVDLNSGYSLKGGM